MHHCTALIVMLSQIWLYLCQKMEFMHSGNGFHLSKVCFELLGALQQSTVHLEVHEQSNVKITPHFRRKNSKLLVTDAKQKVNLSVPLLFRG